MKNTNAIHKNPFQWSISPDISGSTPKLTEIEANGFVAWIKPETFLKLAYDIRGSERNLKFLEEQWDENSPIAIPFLMLEGYTIPSGKKRGETQYTAVGHEGRHRCMVSRNNGLKLVPVAFFIYDYDEGPVRGPDLTTDVVDNILNRYIRNQDNDKLVNLKSDIFWLDGSIYVDGIEQNEITIEECLRLGSMPVGAKNAI